MNLLKHTRHAVTQGLYQAYKKRVPCFQVIETALQKRGNASIVLDHFALIDLPSVHSGIPYLSAVFSALGYQVQGADYLPDKQNDFSWLVEADAVGQTAAHTLPQVVVADFRLDALPSPVRKTIEKYTCHIVTPALSQIQYLGAQIEKGDTAAAAQLAALLLDSFSKRSWPLPTLADFKRVEEANALLAWVLLFGPIPNHFTIAAHLLRGFPSMQAYMDFIALEQNMPLNTKEGVLKGSAERGIEQGATLGEPIEVAVADGSVRLPGPFVEFVWRYAKTPGKVPLYWQDYYTGFIAQQADTVIESLYA
jgi:hypothetical protein